MKMEKYQSWLTQSRVATSTDALKEPSTRTKKKNSERPWLTRNGVAIPTMELKEIVKTWDSSTWAAYLKWYEHPSREKLLIPGVYTEIGERFEDTIFEQFAQSVTPAKRNLCERLLAKLPKQQQTILRLYFLEGITDSKIAAIVKRSKSNVGHHKNQALTFLKRGIRGDFWVICHFMRGEKSEASKKNEKNWDKSLQIPLKENRAYLPENQVRELEILQNLFFRVALDELSEQARTIIYLRYFCDFSVRQIAQRLTRGENVVEMTEIAGVSETKRKYIEFQTGFRPGEGELC